LYKNKKTLAKVRKGLKDAKEGKVKRLGDFSKFVAE
jgi:hypothetical protein